MEQIVGQLAEWADPWHFDVIDTVTDCCIYKVRLKKKTNTHAPTPTLQYPKCGVNRALKHTHTHTYIYF